MFEGFILATLYEDEHMQTSVVGWNVERGTCLDCDFSLSVRDVMPKR